MIWLLNCNFGYLYIYRTIMAGTELLHQDHLEDSQDLQLNPQDLQNTLDALGKLKPIDLRNLDKKFNKIKDLISPFSVDELIAQHTLDKDSLWSLKPHQVDGLYALRKFLNPTEDSPSKMTKKDVRNLDKEGISNESHYANVKNTLAASWYRFEGWKDGNKVGSAVFSQGEKHYILPFKIDGTLDATAPIESPVYTKTDNGLKKTTDSVFAYMKNGFLTIEKSEDYKQKEKNKSFVESLQDVSTEGVFLTNQLDNWVMKVGYLSSDKIIDFLAEGKWWLKDYVENISILQTTLKNATEDAKKITLQEPRTEAINNANKKYTDAISENMPIYKQYLQKNADIAIDHIDQNDAFTVKVDSTLSVGSNTTALTISWKENPETVNNYKSLNGGDLLVSIDKTSNSTGWNVYKKNVVDWKDVYDMTQSEPQIDPNAQVEDQAPKTEVVSDRIEWNEKIDALKTGFMFEGTGAIKNKEEALATWKEALKKLIADPAKKETGKNIFNGLTVAAVSWNKTPKQREYITWVQNSIGIVGDAADGLRWPKSHAKLLEFAGVTQPTATETVPAPVVTTEWSNKPKPTETVPAPKTVEKKKTTIDALAPERKQLVELQETAKRDINPLLKKLVPTGTTMQDYIKHLPSTYTQQLTILDQTLTMDPKTISDKVVFEKSYPSMSINVKNLMESLNALNRRTTKDYSDFFKLPYNQNQVNAVLASVTKFNTVRLDNSRSNNLQQGYIKFSDPTNKSLSSRFPANFLSSPIYKNRERVVNINKDLLATSINDRVRQTAQLNVPKDISRDVFV
jgi:hypothetical protein